jgi:hypothetical protein
MYAVTKDGTGMLGIRVGRFTLVDVTWHWTGAKPAVSLGLDFAHGGPTIGLLLFGLGVWVSLLEFSEEA